jgi:hypothetical protein
MKWTESEERRFAELVSDGLSAGEIAKKLKKGTPAIRSKMRRVRESMSRLIESVTKSTKLTAKTFEGWTYQDLKALHTMRCSSYNWQDIGNCLQRPATDCQSMFESLDWGKFIATGEISSIIQPISSTPKNTPDVDSRDFSNDVHMERVKMETLNSQAEYRREVSQRARWDMLVNMVKSAITVAPPVQPCLATLPEKLADRFDPEEMGLIISDVHVGESFTMADTHGLCEYNMDVFRQRAENLKERVDSIARRHQMLYNLETLNIFSLGDIVQGLGHVGKWGPAYTEQNVVNQVFEACNVFAEMLIHWLGVFNKIKFCGVFGNHGRGAPVGLEKEMVNWDYIFYKVLELTLQNYADKIKFDIPPSWWMMPNVQGSKFLMLHADNTKSVLGLPYYGLVRGERRQIGIVGEIFDFMLCGHFHTAAEIETNTGRIIVNGSWVGGDVHSLKHMQSSSRPSQKVFGIHPKRGITWQYQVDLRGDDEGVVEGRHRPK